MAREYSDIFFHYSLLSTGHLSNFTPWGPHAPPTWDTNLPGFDPPVGRRSFGLEAPKVPRLWGAEGSSPSPRRLRHPQIRFRLSFVTGEIRWTPPSSLAVSATGLVPVFTKHHTRCVTVSSNRDLRTKTSGGLRWRQSSEATRQGKARLSPQHQSQVNWPKPSQFMIICWMKI
jgi:hypothetical protein